MILHPKRTQVWSSGGGVQSCAIAALIVMGKLPKPDIALIVDTGREKQSTWDYMDAVISPALASVGVTLERIHKDKWATVDLWGGEEGKSILLPMFTTQNSEEGKSGKLPTYCSNEWKARVIQRELRSRSVTACDMWMGMSLDEMKRVKYSGPGWLRKFYPLVFDKPFGVPMRREGCVEVVKAAGWPPAPRSACWFCPNMSDAEWYALKTSSAEFEKAAREEDEIRKIDPNAFLHPSGVPLREVDFSAAAMGERVNLFNIDGCESGHCFV